MLLRVSPPHLVFAFLLALAACDEAPSNDQAASSATPPPVSVALPIKQEIREWDEFTGRFGAVTTVELQARVAGFIDQILFDDGALVNAGDTLFVIDKRPLEIAREAAAGDLAAAQADQEFTAREASRGEELLERNVISREAADERRRAAQMAQAALVSARARLADAELDLSFADVKSPIDGRASRQFVNAGNLVSGGDNGGTTLTRIVSIDPIHFYFDASEQEYLKYARLSRSGSRSSSRDAANPVWVKLDDEDEFGHEGKMDFIDNRLSPDTGTIRGRAIFDNSDGFIQPGMFGRLRLSGSDPYEAILLPDAAIGSNQNNKYVLVVDEAGTVEYRPVEIGPLHEGMRIIREGLAADDVVVVSGLLRARPGGKVTAQMTTLSIEQP